MMGGSDNRPLLPRSVALRLPEGSQWGRTRGNGGFGSVADAARAAEPEGDARSAESDGRVPRLVNDILNAEGVAVVAAPPSSWTIVTV
jgi:hypothetical protein